MSAAAVFETTATVYLHPGQIHVTSEAAIVSTILGSCVSVCLWDPLTRIAGINHFLLPSTPLRGSDDARFGNAAMEKLLEAMARRGTVDSRLVAKIFGGACVMKGFSGPRQAIGAQNADVAREILTQRGIRVAAEQTGGTHGRKLHFHTVNGSAYVKEI
jgi:chemotaxis protein CheD